MSELRLYEPEAGEVFHAAVEAARRLDLDGVYFNWKVVKIRGKSDAQVEREYYGDGGPWNA